jgi:SAM-dependent methyltransferase
MAANEAQVEMWNTRSGATWVRFQDQLDRQIDALGLATMDALGPKSGEAVLDIGCGCGQTSVELAGRVGQTGRVLGVDVSEPMLAVARERRAPPFSGEVEYLQADAQTTNFGPRAFDGAFSRFGVMFFDDPVAAFANIHSAMRAGGRLAFLCWRSPAENPLMTAPMRAAAPLLPPSQPGDPLAPGPFAFADADRVRSILDSAGWTDARLDAHDQLSGAQPLADAIELALNLGPLGIALRENPERREAVREVLGEAFEPYLKDGIVRMPTATWIVTATA